MNNTGSPSRNAIRCRPSIRSREGHGVVKIASSLPKPYRKAAAPIPEPVSTEAKIAKIEKALENGMYSEMLDLAAEMIRTHSRDLPTDLAQRVFLAGLGFRESRNQLKRIYTTLELLAKKIAGEISLHEFSTLYSKTLNAGAGYTALARKYFS